MKERFKTLDIFRGIFSSFVVFFHMSAFSNTIVINNSFIYNSYLFVDFFFVLSGFVIAYAYQSISSWAEFGKFYKKRFYRLYPLHLIMLLIFVLIAVIKHLLSAHIHVNQLDYNTDNWRSFIVNLFLLNSIKVLGVKAVSWNIASWSISAEMIAYLVFGITVTFINRNKINAFKTYFYLALVLIALGLMFTIDHTFNINYSFDYGYLRSIFGFFIGVQGFNLYKRMYMQIKSAKAVLFNILEPVCLTGTLIMIGFGDVLKPVNFIYDIAFFVTIVVFAFEKGWVSAMLNKVNVLHNMGKYSYSIYMIHTLILSLFNVLFIRVLKLPPTAYWYLFIVNYIIVYLLSAWTYKNIEMRFNISARPEGKKVWWMW